ncbi:hypothetical protein WOLCODRAFT_93025 [Wolfiporia cocos MD-104 SS10]|uniref:Ribosomal protein/NADH dehydrogenase domain-containing protein n=1 Tax=Wolfiporia cocos (strain MD-104) TaxID=742152 RepID=A0A2H3IT55_WOLCO|nr:hypothetical protein WOLCODRAFT_93025 [Wolfiporia cocos MD-104 SS10]
MVPKSKAFPGPSRLSRIIVELQKEPRPHLNSVKSLKLTYAFRNDHFAARHFVKEDLPRIRHVNPSIGIEVVKIPKTPQDSWQPEMVVEFQNGTTQTLNMNKPWSSEILQELMDMAGGPSWQRWKKEREEAGLPILDPPKPREPKPQSVEDLLFARPHHQKTGAAAVLP